MSSDPRQPSLEALIAEIDEKLSKITPGEWRANMPGRWVEGQAFDGSWKFICAPRIHGGTPQQAGANTALIASAPRLLAAAREALAAAQQERQLDAEVAERNLQAAIKERNAAQQERDGLAHLQLETADKLEAAEAERDKARARAIVAEHHKTLELLSKGSAVEQLEMQLRTKLAETEIRAEAAEAKVRRLREAIRSAIVSMAISNYSIAENELAAALAPTPTEGQP